MSDDNIEAQRLNQSDDEDYDGNITEIRIGKDDTCCCCGIYRGFYAYSAWYIIVAIFLFSICAVDYYNNGGDVSFFVGYGILRLVIGIIGINVTSKLSNNDMPTQSIVNLWAMMALWIPIIFNVITWSLIAGVWILFYAASLNVTEDESTKDVLNAAGVVFFVYIIFISIPIIVDTSIAISFYVKINKFIEKATKMKVMACFWCNCC
eukprot:276718_1